MDDRTVKSIPPKLIFSPKRQDPYQVPNDICSMVLKMKSNCICSDFAPGYEDVGLETNLTLYIYSEAVTIVSHRFSLPKWVLVERGFSFNPVIAVPSFFPFSSLHYQELINCDGSQNDFVSCDLISFSKAIILLTAAISC